MQSWDRLKAIVTPGVYMHVLPWGPAHLCGSAHARARMAR